MRSIIRGFLKHFDYRYIYSEDLDEYTITLKLMISPDSGNSVIETESFTVKVKAYDEDLAFQKALDHIRTKIKIIKVL